EHGMPVDQPMRVKSPSEALKPESQGCGQQNRFHMKIFSGSESSGLDYLFMASVSRVEISPEYDSLYVLSGSTSATPPEMTNFMASVALMAGRGLIRSAFTKKSSPVSA